MMKKQKARRKRTKKENKLIMTMIIVERIMIMIIE